MTTIFLLKKIKIIILTILISTVHYQCVSQTIYKLPYTPSDAVFDDYDQDGDNDILISCSSSDTVVVLNNTGFGNMERIDLSLSSGVIFKLALMDSDEYPDLVTGDYYYLNDENGGFEEDSIHIPHNHNNIRFEDVNDMDNNGYPDII